MDSIGELGEKFVAQCLENKGWKILHHRWYCPWGEIDLIAYSQLLGDQIAFIEVKTRRKYNWDLNGLLAITPSKQAKLWKTAATFLSQYPELADHPCRFDVALVTYTPGYQFTLQEYLEAAFQ
ncbi:YraN family protein [Gloeocapsa sp. PCC 73106]|uniref:YraN family protein n=1 Tax=Gloeocapsa sp. PCC 73106 TaxID=102232 RepID=UPI0002ACA5A9|nr:YraN family protein [Gloeocapsa sp. PCC 73106]ELR97032.1 TIGR00252 family protein [Gloeocapsa sp. PCC 73106]